MEGGAEDEDRLSAEDEIASQRWRGGMENHSIPPSYNVVITEETASA